MTWGFLYLVGLLVGLVLAAATGLLQGLARIGGAGGVTAPRHDASPALWSRLGRSLAAALSLFGLIGLALASLSQVSPSGALTLAIAAGTLAAGLAFLLYRPRRAGTSHQGLGTVIREIRPGGYGQIRLEEGGAILAAQGVEDEVIPVGTAVEILDAERSVVRVRRATS